MWGILAGVYILAVKEWVFHLGLAFRRSCFVFIVSYIFLAVCVFFVCICMLVSKRAAPKLGLCVSFWGTGGGGGLGVL